MTLASVVTAAVEASEPIIREAGHHLDIAVPPVPIWLDGDPVRLGQIASNLLNNAAHYTERGGRIWLEAEVRRQFGVQARQVESFARRAAGDNSHWCQRPVIFGCYVGASVADLCRVALAANRHSEGTDHDYPGRKLFAS